MRNEHREIVKELKEKHAWSVDEDGKLFVFIDNEWVDDSFKIDREIYKLGTLNSTLLKEAKIELKNTVPQEINLPAYLIPLRNGIFNLKEQKLLPKEEGKMYKNQVPVNFNANAYCESVDKFLESISNGDPEMRNLLEEEIGSCLIRNIMFVKIFWHFGEGRNGKSLFLKMLKCFLGDINCAWIDPNNLKRFDVKNLKNKLINGAGDIPGKIEDISFLKKITGGDEVYADQKFKEQFNFINYSKQILLSNELPKLAKIDDAIRERFIIIPHHQTFLQGSTNYDPQLEQKLMTEEAKSYLFNLALRGIYRLCKNKKFSLPKASEDIMIEVAENTIVKIFINEMARKHGSLKEFLTTEVINKSCTYVYELFYSWKSQVHKNGEISCKAFGQELRKLLPMLVIRHTANFNCYVLKDGVQL